MDTLSADAAKFYWNPPDPASWLRDYAAEQQALPAEAV